MSARRAKYTGKICHYSLLVQFGWAKSGTSAFLLSIILARYCTCMADRTVNIHNQPAAITKANDINVCVTDDVLELLAMHRLDRSRSVDPDRLRAHLASCEECVARLRDCEMLIYAIRAAFSEASFTVPPKRCAVHSAGT
jgi:hypothetical protein